MRFADSCKVEKMLLVCEKQRVQLPSSERLGVDLEFAWAQDPELRRTVIYCMAGAGFWAAGVFMNPAWRFLSRCRNSESVERMRRVSLPMDFS